MINIIILSRIYIPWLLRYQSALHSRVRPVTSIIESASTYRFCRYILRLKADVATPLLRFHNGPALVVREGNRNGGNVGKTWAAFRSIVCWFEDWSKSLLLLCLHSGWKEANPERNCWDKFWRNLWISSRNWNTIKFQQLIISSKTPYKIAECLSLIQ